MHAVEMLMESTASEQDIGNGRIKDDEAFMCGEFHVMMSNIC